MMPCQRSVGLRPDEKMFRLWPRRKPFGTKFVNRLKISTIESGNRVTETTGEMHENLSLLFRATEELNLSAHGLQSRRTLCVTRAGHLSKDKQQGAIRRRLHAVVRLHVSIR